MGASSSNCSESNAAEKWSFQEWKSDEVSNTRTGRPVYDKLVMNRVTKEGHEHVQLRCRGVWNGHLLSQASGEQASGQFCGE